MSKSSSAPAAAAASAAAVAALPYPLLGQHIRCNITQHSGRTLCCMAVQQADAAQHH
jgi:hypothetical protein